MDSVTDKVGTIRRWTVALFKDVQTASKSWVDFKSRQQPVDRDATFDAFRSMFVDLKMIAKAFDMNLTSFNTCIGILEDLQIRAQSGDISPNLFNPSVMSKGTLALRDIRGAVKELMADARDLIPGETASYELSAYGADLGVIVSTFVTIARILKLNAASFARVRDTVYAQFQIVTDTLLQNLPPSTSVTEGPMDTAKLAARIRKATIVAKTDPDRAIAWLDALHKSLQ